MEIIWICICIFLKERKKVVRIFVVRVDWFILLAFLGLILQSKNIYRIDGFRRLNDNFLLKIRQTNQWIIFKFHQICRVMNMSPMTIITFTPMLTQLVQSVIVLKQSNQPTEEAFLNGLVAHTLRIVMHQRTSMIISATVTPMSC